MRVTSLKPFCSNDLRHVLKILAEEEINTFNEAVETFLDPECIWAAVLAVHVVRDTRNISFQC